VCSQTGASSSTVQIPGVVGQNDLEITIHGETESIYAYDSLDPTYVANAKILWTPVFVRYLIDLTPQWDLFVLTGFGWFLNAALTATTYDL
jgi:hypothetical protein